MNRKKLVVVIVALAMLFTLMVPAFAFADGTIVHIGLISYIFENNYQNNLQVHYWGDNITSGDVTVTDYSSHEVRGCLNDTYWSGEPQTFYVYDVTLPEGATGFKLHHGESWYGNDASVQGGWIIVFEYSGSYNFWNCAPNPHNHQLVEHPAVSATCTEDGNSAYWECSATHDYYSDADGLNWIVADSWVIPALGHSMEYHAATDSTCTENGTLDYYYCTRCQKYFGTVNGENENTSSYFLQPSSKPALGHEWNYYDQVDADDDTYTTATATFTCQRSGCGHVETVENIALTFDREVNADNCTDSNWQVYTYSFTFENVPHVGELWKELPPSHDLVHHNAQEATCTEPGWNAYDTCSRCDYTTYEEIPATGHQLIEHPAVAATCTTDGNIHCWQCDVCGAYFSDAQGQTEIPASSFTIPQTGHDWGQPDYAWAKVGDNWQCTATRVCNNGDHPETETVTATSAASGNDTVYTADFTNEAFVDQTKTVGQYHYDNLDVTNGIPAAPSGEFFAAWFANADYSGEPLGANADITNAYAKFIKVETMTVAVQIRQVSSDGDSSHSDVRFITTVPDSKYFAKIGFRVTVPSHNNAVVSSGEIDSSSNYLYDSIISLGSPVTVAAFGSGKFDHRDSAKLAVQTVTGMPAGYFDAGNTYRIKVVPYIVTNDNRTIEGPAKFFKGATETDGRTFKTASSLEALG